MTEVFDAAREPFDQYWNLLLPGAALLLAVILLIRGARRRWLWIGLGLSVFLFLLFFVLPLADHRHVQALATGGSVRTVEGFISGHKRETRRIWTGTSHGVGVTSSNTYRTSTEEQFFVGRQWFWFEVGGMPSHASFTNVGDPPLPLKDGNWVRVSYVTDPWYQDQTRIVRLVLVGPGGRVADALPKAGGNDGFEAFWRRFAIAAGRGDEGAVRAATRFPFLFSGTPLGADQFHRVWEALFAPLPLRQCLASVEPVADGESWSVSCGVYVYVFERTAREGWRLASFAADPEAGL